MSKLIDTSGQGNTGQITGALATKDGMAFDGVDDKVDIADATSIQNIFDGGGSISVKVKALSDGEGTYGRMFDKVGWRLYVSSESAGYVKVNFFQDFSTTDGYWSTAGRDLVLSQDSTITINYDNSAVGNDPIIYVDGNNCDLTEAVTPVGTRITDVGSALVMGNNSAGTFTWDGELKDARLYNYTQSKDEAVAYHNSFIKPVIRESFSDSGADGIVKTPRGWIKGTAAGKIDELSAYVNNDLDIGNKYFEFTTAGTMFITGIDLSSYVSNGYIEYYYYNGSSWSKREGLIDAPVTGVAYSNSVITFTGDSIGDRITNIKITNQVRQ